MSLPRTRTCNGYLPFRAGAVWAPVEFGNLQESWTRHTHVVAELNVGFCLVEVEEKWPRYSYSLNRRRSL